MPVSIPAEVLDLFDEPALGHVSYIDAGSRIVTFPMWVDYDGSHLLTSSPIGSKKGAALRLRPQVGLSIVSTKNPWHWLSVSGHVVDIRPDDELAFIDKMAHKYLGEAYSRRTLREALVIEIDRARKSWA